MKSPWPSVYPIVLFILGVFISVVCYQQLGGVIKHLLCMFIILFFYFFFFFPPLKLIQIYSLIRILFFKISFYNVALENHRIRKDKKYEWVILLWGWIYPLVASIILATVPSIESSGAFGIIPWCFGSSSAPKSHSNLEYGLFYSFFCIYLLLTTFFIVCTLIKFTFVGVKSTIKKKSFFQLFVLMSIFCIYFDQAVAAILTARFYLQTQESALKQGITDWYACIFSSTKATWQCPKSNVAEGLLYWEGISIGFAGTVLFIIFFILRDRTWRCWTTAISNLINGRPFFADLPGGKTTRTSNRGSGTSRNSNRGSGRSSGTSSDD